LGAGVKHNNLRLINLGIAIVKTAMPRTGNGGITMNRYIADAELLLLSRIYELLRAEVLDSISRQQKLMAGEITVAGLISTLGFMITTAMPLLMSVPFIVLLFYAA